MKKKWCYYLHTNGDLISKNPAIVDSDAGYFDGSFVKKVWMIDLEERADSWRLILESLALGARIERVKELAEKWNMTKEDSFEMLAQVLSDKVSELMKDGMTIFIEKILEIDLEAYWAEVKSLGDKEKAGVK